MFKVLSTSKCYSLQDETIINDKTIPELLSQHILVKLNNNQCHIQSNQNNKFQIESDKKDLKNIDFDLSLGPKSIQVKNLVLIFYAQKPIKLKIFELEYEPPLQKKIQFQWRIITSGFDTIGNIDFYRKNKILICSSFKDEPNILIMNKFQKTAKFIIAINKGILVVSSQWLCDCINTKTLLNPKEYIFKCKQLNVQKSINIAKNIKPFKDLRFTIPEQLINKFSLEYDKIREIVESSQAKIVDNGINIIPANIEWDIQPFIDWDILTDKFLNQQWE